jgi:hypothetical protein
VKRIDNKKRHAEKKQWRKKMDWLKFHWRIPWLSSALSGKK